MYSYYIDSIIKVLSICNYRNACSQKPYSYSQSVALYVTYLHHTCYVATYNYSYIASPDRKIVNNYIILQILNSLYNLGC